MSDIAFINVPALNAGLRAVDFDKGISFFRKKVAERKGFQMLSGLRLNVAVRLIADEGYQLLGRAELAYMLSQNSDYLGRKLETIKRARPYEMPIFLFPREDIYENEYPGMAPTPSWMQVSVKSTTPLCSNRFLLPVRDPTT